MEGSTEVTTAARAERAAGVFVAGLRIATLAQMLPSVLVAVTVSRYPGLSAGTWVAAIVAVAITSTLALVNRRPPGTWWACTDTAVAVSLLLLGLMTVPLEFRTGSWVGFQSAYSLSVACSLIGVRDVRLWGILLAALVAARAAFVLPIMSTHTDLLTVIGEILTLLGLAPLAWFGTGAIYRIARDADEAREYAARLAREAEERKARAAIHNGTALMRLLVEQSSENSADSRTPSQLWVQAETELNRMRAYLAGAPGATAANVQDLADLVESVAAEFCDLPLDVVADLARGVELRGEGADVAVALRSVLINVREHSGASRVVLHAGELEDDAGWSVTLHDNGVGFDPTRSRSESACETSRSDSSVHMV